MKNSELDTSNVAEFSARKQYQVRLCRKPRRSTTFGLTEEMVEAGMELKSRELSSTWVPRGMHINGKVSCAPVNSTHVASSSLQPPLSRDLGDLRESVVEATVLVSEAKQLHLPPKKRELILSNYFEVLGEAESMEENQDTTSNQAQSDLGPNTDGQGEEPEFTPEGQEVPNFGGCESEEESSSRSVSSFCSTKENEGLDYQEGFVGLEDLRFLFAQHPAAFYWVAPASCSSVLKERMAGLGLNKMAKTVWKSLVLSAVETPDVVGGAEGGISDESESDSREDIEDNAEEKPVSTVVASLQLYREALASSDESKLAEIESFLKSFEDEKICLERKLASLSEELLIEKDRILRISADFDNFRKRTERERSSLVTNGKGEVVENLLPVLDNFERAKAQIKVETGGEEKINISYQSIYKQLVEILTSLGVVPVETVGNPFDPLLHEAIMREDSMEFEERIIIQEFRKGFKLGDILLRPSMVKVSAGPGPAKPEQALQEEDQDVSDTTKQCIPEAEAEAESA
ncbi:Protein grpE [Morus notabilis]|uniref:GrpE protein homolog n=1 Tax=Morus notabilis TaxID=981085 RepID=W9QF93_9ROSA|nr:Protein grpE [Morus notabilis]